MEHTIGQFPKSGTEVSFYKGDTEGTGRIVLIYADDANVAIVSDRTPFHPKDNNWPDQPGDRGNIIIGDITIKIADSLTWPVQLGITSPSFNPQARAKHQGGTHLFLVAHMVSEVTEKSVSMPPSALIAMGLVGAEMHMQVDREYRQELSRAHSASHLMALALNYTTAGLWRKEVLCDPLGNPDLDHLAIQESRIYPGRSVDIYRIGKSLRKSGFDSTRLTAETQHLAQEVAESINGWITKNSTEPIVITADSGRLDARRWWNTKLNGRDVTIPCGGTHASRLGDIGVQSVTFAMNADATELTISTCDPTGSHFNSTR